MSMDLFEFTSNFFNEFMYLIITTIKYIFSLKINYIYIYINILKDENYYIYNCYFFKKKLFNFLFY